MPEPSSSGTSRMSYPVIQPAPNIASRRGSRLLYVRVSVSCGPAVATEASTAAVVRLPVWGSKSFSRMPYGAGETFEVISGCGTAVSNVEYGEGTSVVGVLDEGPPQVGLAPAQRACRGPSTPALAW